MKDELGKALGRKLSPRDLEIWNGVNIDSARAALYREKWSEKAKISLEELEKKFPPSNAPRTEVTKKESAPNVSDVSEFPCVYRGEKLRDANCLPCRNSGRHKLPIFGCEINIECALRGSAMNEDTRERIATCLGCESRTESAAPSKSRRHSEVVGDKPPPLKWAVAVTTAPRDPATLRACMESTVAAGWSEIEVFAEPETDISGLPAGCRIHQNESRLGPWPNFVAAARFLLAEHKDADAFLLLQDDVLFPEYARELCDEYLWDFHDPSVGFVSLYMSSRYDNMWTVRDAFGYIVGRRVKESQANKLAANLQGRLGVTVSKEKREIGLSEVGEVSFWGACALVFSRRSLELLLEHPYAKGWKKTRNGMIVGVDVVIGKTFHKMGMGCYVLAPGLCQHISPKSSIPRHGSNVGARKATWLTPKTLNEARALLGKPGPIIQKGFEMAKNDQPLGVGGQLQQLCRLQRQSLLLEPLLLAEMDKAGPQKCLENLDTYLPLLSGHPHAETVLRSAIGRASLRGGMLLPAVTGKIAVVAAFFNPQQQKEVFDNYYAWRAQFQPLLDNGSLAAVVTAEAVWDGKAVTDSPIQANENNLLWQKEQLMQLALDALPEDIEYVAFVDADVLFTYVRWVDKVRELLSVFPVMQLFNNVLLSDSPTWGPSVFPGKVAVPVGRATKPGYAWIASRQFLRMGGFYRHAVVGNGDEAMYAAWTGGVPAPNALGSPMEKEFWKNWSTSYADVAGCIGYLPGAIFHLYHGSLEKREYVTRIDILTKADFNPAVDVQTGDNGLLEWSSDKPQLHKDVADYFARRSKK